MLLGQLYHYDKTLDEIQFPLQPELISQVQLMGVSLDTDSEIRQMNPDNLSHYIRDSFTGNYGDILEENNLHFAAQFWNLLTSPLKAETNQEKTLPETSYQQLLLDWIENDHPIEQIPTLLNEGKITTDVQDFALYYGLKVVYTFSHQEASPSHHLPQSTIREYSPSTHDLSSEPQILVFTSTYNAPLYKHLNCIVKPVIQDREELFAKISEHLQSSPSLRLVLIDDVQGTAHIPFLQRKLGQQILVSSLETAFDNTENQTFFDQIVKKTLGIRLTD